MVRCRLRPANARFVVTRTRRCAAMATLLFIHITQKACEVLRTSTHPEVHAGHFTHSPDWHGCQQTRGIRTSPSTCRVVAMAVDVVAPVRMQTNITSANSLT